MGKLEKELLQNTEIEGDQSLLSVEELFVMEDLIQCWETCTTWRRGILRDIRNYTHSYSRMTDEILGALREEERSTDNRYGAKSGLQSL